MGFDTKFLANSFFAAFFGSYLSNTLSVLFIYAIPGAGANIRAGHFDPYVALQWMIGATCIFLLCWWYIRNNEQVDAIKTALLFSIFGIFAVFATTFFTGAIQYAIRVGSFAGFVGVLGRFEQLVFSWHSISLAAEWLIPSLLAGALVLWRAKNPASTSTPSVPAV